MNFLDLVSRDILRRFGNDLSKITMVFPNRRARLFFSKYLANNSENAIWAPQYADLDSLFAVASELKTADDLMLVSMLYDVYIQHFIKENEAAQIETFDEFFFFGETILNDFNDIDKYLVNASQLYGNLQDLETLTDDFQHLTEEQTAILNRFFDDIKTNKTQLKERFFSIWKILGNVYNDFNKELKIKHLAYQGMLQRDALEKIKNDVSCYKQECYVFVGFNVLTACEEKLFSLLKHKSLFYWDFDSYYVDNQNFEAGKFLRKNLVKFPNAMVFDTKNLSHKKNITLVACSSETSQSGYIPLWLNELRKENFEQPDTALVFCNENLLLPVVSFIPPEVEKINITMGFPVAQTPVYDFIIRILDLQKNGIKGENFYYTYVLAVLRHFYTSLIFNDFAKIEEKIITEKIFYSSKKDLNFEMIFTKVENCAQMADYLLNIIKTVGDKTKNVEDDFSSENLYNEAIFRIYKLLNRLKDLLESGYLNVQLPTFISLIKRLLSKETVPFHGEPICGLQLMGMLETRNLDFRNLLIISMNEGVMPKVEPSVSFIPHFMRKHFAMSNIEHQDAIFSYYFYRLLQRAENISLLYNTAVNQTGKSEISRFLLQMLTEFPNREKIKRIVLQNDFQNDGNNQIIIKKTPELLEKIKEKFCNSHSEQSEESREKTRFLANARNDRKNEIIEEQVRNDNAILRTKTLSPSAVNSLIDCSLQFYFRYVADFAKKDEISDELDNNILGSIVHRTIELIYRQIADLQPLIVPKEEKRKNYFEKFIVTKEKIDNYLKHKSLIDKMLELAFEIEFFNRKTPKKQYNGEQLIYFNVAKRFVERLLEYDKQNLPIEICGMELWKQMPYQISDDICVNIGGFIDRIHLKDNELYITDYKTSKKQNAPKSIEHIFDGKDENRAKYVLQAFFYSLILTQEFPQKNIVPVLLYLANMGDLDEFSHFIKIGDLAVEDFKKYLSEFDNFLKSKLLEIFDENIPFSQNFIEKCAYCEFANICGK